MTENTQLKRMHQQQAVHQASSRNGCGVKVGIIAARYNPTPVNNDD